MNDEWKFIERKKKSFDIHFWIKSLLYRIENDKFLINDYLN